MMLLMMIYDDDDDYLSPPRCLSTPAPEQRGAMLMLVTTGATRAMTEEPGAGRSPSSVMCHVRAHGSTVFLFFVYLFYL